VRQPSTNFAFLAPHSDSLARLGALAEWAYHHDPPTTLGKLRLFAELLAELVSARHGLEIRAGESFDAILRLLRDQGILPRRPADLFHYLRRVGNAAIHDNIGTPAEALSAGSTAPYGRAGEVVAQPTNFGGQFRFAFHYHFQPR
jgi:type I restriction enzyme R subunit